MKLVRYTPTRDLATLEDRIDRIFGDLVPWRSHEMLTGGWEPAVDIYETGRDFVMKIELPEVEPKDAHVSVEGSTLTVSGERRKEEEVKEEHVHRTERFYGSFCRTFTLPDTIDREGITAAFKNGVMKLTLPKREESKPREIKVEKAA